MINHKLFLFVLIVALGCIRCATDSQESENGSSASSSKETPHEIIGDGKAKVGSWAYPLDSGFNQFILGNPDYINQMLRSFDNEKFSLDGLRGSMRLLNNQDGELLTVFLCKNKDDDWVPYLMRLEVFYPDRIPPGKKPVRQEDMTWRSSNKLHIRFTEDYFMSLMTEQPLMTWAKADTVYYTHQGQPKDASRLKRYQPADYLATYKFVDGTLRWCEIGVKPEVFEKK